MIGHVTLEELIEERRAVALVDLLRRFEIRVPVAHDQVEGSAQAQGPHRGVVAQGVNGDAHQAVPTHQAGFLHGHGPLRQVVVRAVDAVIDQERRFLPRPEDLGQGRLHRHDEVGGAELGHVVVHPLLTEDLDGHVGGAEGDIDQDALRRQSGFADRGGGSLGQLEVEEPPLRERADASVQLRGPSVNGHAADIGGGDSQLRSGLSRTDFDRVGALLGLHAIRGNTYQNGEDKR